MKPGREIYQDALDKLGCSPGDCVFVDDLEANVAAAEAFGFRAIHYRAGMDLSAAILGQ
jgi:putative hydrolase of the HAD superfamily